MRRPPLFNIPDTPVYDENFAAPQLLGVVWSCCLHGVLVVQFYVYCYNFSRDNKYIKLLVYSIFLLETEQTALNCVDLYHMFAVDFYLFLIPSDVPYYLRVFDLNIPRAVISLSVQLFFVYRILALRGKRSWWLCVIICPLSIVSALAALASGALSYLEQQNLDIEILMDLGIMIGIIKWAVIAECIRYASGVLSDLLIASVMLHHLRKIWVRDRKLSDHSFVSMVRLTVETNLATATVGIITFITLVLYITSCFECHLGHLGPSVWYYCPAYIFGKLYSNTLLVCLNNRIPIRDNSEAHGAVVDCEAVTRRRNGACPESTTNTLTLEPERPQNDCMNEPVLEAGVEERVNIPTNADTVTVRCMG